MPATTLPESAREAEQLRRNIRREQERTADGASGPCACRRGPCGGAKCAACWREDLAAVLGEGGRNGTG